MKKIRWIGINVYIVILISRYKNMLCQNHKTENNNNCGSMTSQNKEF